jgi:hypothetical protein
VTVSDEASPRLSPRGDAITSFVLGFFPTLGIGAVLALFFGYRGRRRLDAAGIRDGRWMATAGVVLGWIGVALAILVWALVVVALVSGA